MTPPKPTALSRSNILRVFLAIPLIALTAAWPAAALGDDEARWFGDHYDDMAILAYGIPDSDYVALYFKCAPGTGIVQINLQDERSGARAGERLPIRLRAGGRQVEFSAQGIENQDSGGADFSAELPLDDALRRLLGSSGGLDITIKGRTEHYPLAGAAEPAARLLAACDASKPSGRPAK